MFIPYDYQLDYLKALHTFYYAYPNPIRVIYYSLSNKENIANATSITKSYYSHPLDDTSIAMYSRIKNLPVYYTQAQDPRQNRATETGNLAVGNPFSVVIPAIYGLQPEIDDFVYFSSTTAKRMYRVSNVEYVNLFEQSELRAFRIELVVDKYYTTEVIDQRVDQDFEFSFDFSRILTANDFDLVENKLLPLLMYNLLKLDQKSRYEYVDVFLSRFYQEYKIYMDVMINKGEYNYFDLLKDYNRYDYSMLFSIPSVVMSIPDVNNLDEVKTCVTNLNNKQICNLLPTFSQDYINNNIQVQYETEISNDPMKRIIVIRYGLEALKSIIEG